MSLATRCTACGTIFRVLQDQLKVSEGWVRCGRCDAVFQATEALFDLEREAPPAWDAGEAASRPSASGQAPPYADDAERGARRSAEAEADRPAEPFEAPATAEATLRALSAAAAAADVDARRVPPVPALRPDARSHGTGRSKVHADTHPYSDTDTDTDTDADADAIVAPSAWAEPSAAAGAVAAVQNPRSSERPVAPPIAAWPPRSAGWRTGVGLSFIALVLTVALAAQAARQFSDITAARWPATRSLLTPWCRWTGCSLAAPRRIDEVLVESTSLAADPGTDALRIGIVLRNRAPHAVALPSVDLSLTDSAGRLIARRSLQPADFKPGTDALPPRSDLPLQALLVASGGHVTGYTVEIFYP